MSEAKIQSAKPDELVEALRAFDTARRAALSQVPMLALMMLFTTFGLWILSMPLAAGG